MPARARKIVNEFSNMPNKKVSFQGKEKHMELCSLSERKRVSPLLYKQKEKLDFVKPEYEIERIILTTSGRKFSMFLMSSGRN
jgi:CRISPR-associated protein Cas1